MFRPCIDLHEGRVKQLVGGSLGSEPSRVRTNFVSEHPASWYARLYKRDRLTGGHVIMLGPGNEAEARSALREFPSGMQVGGGINAENADQWLEAGASHVIVTSWLFREGRLDFERIKTLENRVGKQRLVLDLSCRRRADQSYVVMTECWQKFTDLTLDAATLTRLSGFCAEFLVHAVDVEGLCRGVDMDLVSRLAEWSPIPVTYAGGARSIEDLERVTEAGKGSVHLTVGSALDIFGGTGVRYGEAVAFNRKLALSSRAPGAA